MPSDTRSFWATIWHKLRSTAIATGVELGEYLLLWLGIIVAHFVERLMGAIGVDPELVSVIALLEKGVFLSTFLSFFWRILIRAYHSARKSDRL